MPLAMNMLTLSCNIGLGMLVPLQTVEESLKHTKTVFIAVLRLSMKR